MLSSLWAFLFGGEVEQCVVMVNASTQDAANSYRQRLRSLCEGDAPPVRIQLMDKLGDGEGLITTFVSGGLLKRPWAEVDAIDFDMAEPTD